MSPAAAAAATSYLATGAALSRPRGIRLSLLAAPASLRAAPAPCRAVIAPISAPRSSPAASPPERFDFVKYKGHDNVFIMVDNRDSSVPKVTPKLAATLCDRNIGFSADGVILAMPGVNGAGYTMKVFNSDGSELVFSKMGGNAACAFAWYIADLENRRGTNSSKIHTGAGIIIPQIQSDGQVKVDMGEPSLSGPEIPTKLPATRNKAVVQAELEVEGSTWHVTCVSMGNPHCVTFGSKELKVLQVDDLELSEIGPKFEHHEMFPVRTNTGATPACGTGACAAVVAAYLEGQAERKCIVDMPGGPLEIEWREDDNHVYMTVPPVRTAPAEAVMAQGKSACPPGHGCGCGYDAICDKVEEIHCREAARNDSRPIWLEVLGIIANPNLIVPLAGITMVATALSRGWVKIEPISSNLIVLLAGFMMLVMAVSRGWVKIEPISVTDILKYYNSGGRHG